MTICEVILELEKIKDYAPDVVQVKRIVHYNLETQHLFICSTIQRREFVNQYLIDMTLLIRGNEHHFCTVVDTTYLDDAEDPKHIANEIYIAVRSYVDSYLTDPVGIYNDLNTNSIYVIPLKDN